MKKTATLCLLITTAFCSTAQSLFNLRGKVVDEYSNPVYAATIHILNTEYRLTTDKEGRFLVNDLRNGLYTLNVSVAGYATINIEIKTDTLSGEIRISVKPDYKQLSEVLVNAQKTEELLQKTSVPITAIQEREVRDYRLWNINEATAIAPNFYAADPGDKRNVSSIRGITSTSYDPAVATYIDGVNQFSLDTYIPQLFDIDRIEIARGPQGTLYGRNAMGGVINILTKQPGNKTTVFAEISAGNRGQQRYSAGIRTPIIKDKLFAGAAGLYESMNGFYTNVYNDTYYDKQHTISGNYYLRLLANQKLSFTVNIKHSSNRNNGAFPLVVDMQQAFENPYKLNQNATTKMIDNTLNASISVNYTGKAFNVVSQTAYQSNYRYYKQPIDADFSPLDGFSIINDYGNQWNNIKVFTEELKFTSPSSSASALNWVGGIYFFRQHSPVKQTTRFGKDAVALGAPDANFSLINTTKTRSTGLAFFGQAVYHVNTKFSLTAGMRYDYEHKQQNILGEYQKDPDPGPMFAFRTDTSASVDFSSLSPTLSLNFTPSINHDIFVRYSKGFRAGGLTPLTSNPSQPALVSFKPELSNNIEVGSKNVFFRNSLTLNVAIFYSKISDVQVPTLVLPDAVTITKNTGKLTSRGFELESKTLLNRLELNYSFGYTNATYDRLRLSQNGTEIDLRAKKQIFTPDITSMLAIQYFISIGKSQTTRIVLRGEWKYLGRQYFDLANRISQPSYHTINTKVGVSSLKYSTYFWTRNLNDARFVGFAYDFGAVHLGDPRTYGLTLDVRL
jgi:iron complex outermembrane receptor protein